MASGEGIEKDSVESQAQNAVALSQKRRSYGTGTSLKSQPLHTAMSVHTVSAEGPGSPPDGCLCVILAFLLFNSRHLHVTGCPQSLRQGRGEHGYYMPFLESFHLPVMVSFTFTFHWTRVATCSFPSLALSPVSGTRQKLNKLLGKEERKG